MSIWRSVSRKWPGTTSSTIEVATNTAWRTLLVRTKINVRLAMASKNNLLFTYMNEHTHICTISYCICILLACCAAAVVIGNSNFSTYHALPPGETTPWRFLSSDFISCNTNGKWRGTSADSHSCLFIPTPRLTEWTHRTANPDLHPPAMSVNIFVVANDRGYESSTGWTVRSHQWMVMGVNEQLEPGNER